MIKFSLVSVLIVLATLTPHYADSLMKSQVRDPAATYVLQPKARKTYDYKVHDTILIDLTIKETLIFTKKHETKKKQTWGTRLNNFLTYFGKERPDLPDVEFEVDNQNKTKGKLSDKKDIRLKIPAEVIEIQPNGDLILDASRTVFVSEDSALVRMGGRVNPMFIKNQSVSADRILQLDVKTESEGPISDNQRRGFITRFFDNFKVF